MKNIFIASLLIFCFPNTIFAQKVVKVTITTTMGIEKSLLECKEAGKKAKFGSRDYQISESSGTVTLWKNIGKLDFYCEVNATFKNGITELRFRMPKLAGGISFGGWKGELKKITKKLDLADKMVGKYSFGIE